MKSIMLINTIQLFQQNYNSVEDEEFNLFLFSLLILGLIGIFICVSIGIIITLLLLLVVFGLITVGALSGSILVGLNKKSFTAGFKTFVIIFSTASSAIIGGLSFWLLNKLLHWWTPEIAICTGIVSGLLGGFALGFFAAFIIQKVTTFLKAKLVRKSKLD
ncbi:MAG TPA: hypothetical protein VF677_03880 [Flavobacterium sp.]|jgi:hypothetical protein